LKMRMPIGRLAFPGPAYCTEPGLGLVAVVPALAAAPRPVPGVT